MASIIRSGDENEVGCIALYEDKQADKFFQKLAVYQDVLHPALRFFNKLVLTTLALEVHLDLRLGRLADINNRLAFE